MLLRHHSAVLAKQDLKLEEQSAVLIENTQVLAEHQRRSLAHEAHLKLLDSSVGEITTHVNVVQGIGAFLSGTAKWILTLGGIVGMIYGAATAIFNWIK